MLATVPGSSFSTFASVPLPGLSVAMPRLSALKLGSSIAVVGLSAALPRLSAAVPELFVAVPGLDATIPKLFALTSMSVFMSGSSTPILLSAFAHMLLCRHHFCLFLYCLCQKYQRLIWLQENKD